MKKYDEYKDSGVAWIGEVPKHWEVIPFKRAMTINNGSDYKHIQVDVSGYPVIGSGGEFARASQYVYDGEVVLLGRKGTIDKPMYYNGKFWTVDTMFYAIPKKYINCKYLYYQALNIPFERYATATALPSMTQTDLNMNVICLPPTIEQTAIATYLDTHCAKIDNLISIQQKRIALLQELKQSVITHAVTKGLDPNVEMKQSGVEWIGDVPKHWKVCKLKHYSHIVLGKMLMTSPPKGSEGSYTLEKYLKSKNVGWLQLFLEEDNIDEMWFNQYEKSIYKLQENDIVMNEGGDIGKVSCWRGVDFDCYIQNSINKITADYKRVNAGFLCYWLYNLSSLGYFWSIVSQISIAHLTKEKLSNSPVVLPPITEQAAIASYLDHKCATIDTSISNAQHQIDLLQEYKQSLITEVVTGKRKVTDN